MTLQLATDVQAQQSKLAGYLNAKVNVARYVAALQNTDISGVNFKALPKELQDNLPVDPAVLLQSVNEHLATAKAHGLTWSNDIQPDLTKIPQAIINYNATFQEVVKMMMPIVKALIQDPNGDRTELVELFQGLLEQIGEGQTNVTAEIAKLKQFNADVTADHGNFSSANTQFATIKNYEEANLQALQTAIQGLESAIEALNKAIGITEITAGVSGGLIVAGGAVVAATGATGVGAVIGGLVMVVGIVGLSVSIAEMVKAMNEKLDDQKELANDQMEVTELTLQIQALDTCEKALSALVSMSQTAMESVQVILDTWATLQTKIQAVIDDLNKSEKHIGDILSVVDLNIATDQWNQLDTFANSIQDFDSKVLAAPPVPVEPLKLGVKVIPPVSAAA